jgi:hypothetical protein
MISFGAGIGREGAPHPALRDILPQSSRRMNVGAGAAKITESAAAMKT